MEKLVLHVGSFKAGSTTIQECLSKCNNELEKHGIQFIDGRKFDFSRDSSFLKLKEYLNIDCELCIISSEFIFPMTKEKLISLKDNFKKIFKCAEVFIYLRDPIDILPSWASENIKHGYNQSDIDIALSKIDTWETISHIQRFVSVFGRESVKVYKFHKDDFLDNNLIKDFIYKSSNKKIDILYDSVVSNKAITVEGAIIAKILNHGQTKINPVVTKLLHEIPGGKITNTVETVSRLSQNKEHLYSYLKKEFDIDFPRHDPYSYPEVQSSDLEKYFNDIVNVFKKYILSEHEINMLKMISKSLDDDMGKSINEIINRYS